MSRQQDQQAIALAAMCQAASLVDQIATRGMVPQNSYETCLRSIFVTNPRNTEEIYGGERDLPYNLSLGLKCLSDLVEKRRGEQNRNQINYVLSMLTLQMKLAANDQMMDTLGKRIEQIRQQARYFAGQDQEGDPLDHPEVFTHSSIVANIASLYQETISTFSFRINVGGDPRHLQNAENAAKIRALLLAGIRAAMLWRQVGGRRWHLFFFKHRIRPSLARLQAHD
ncbi:high frequency lysogenization protein HflD [Marinobacterium nitratireducens]|uniref:High frequency lysogenization protein HflD homolog n=1 Tax=Marinobacterium nitratireducens TaxID=518897 RepID=A0A918DNI0_9GAMM|nr:high frequency lysogenization protein HflD [Marinobacterium nitratireducens]GGO76942.1 high frequency lysogenization protein HflD [Marinobacterium nitratireducens]